MTYTKKDFEEKLDRVIENGLTHFALDEVIGDQGAQALSKALENDKYLSLTHFSLTRGKISDKGIKILTKPLKNGKCPNLNVFGLFNNKVGDEGTRALSELLKSRNPIKLQLTIGCISKENRDFLLDQGGDLSLCSGYDNPPSYIKIGPCKAFGLVVASLFLGFGLAVCLEGASAVFTSNTAFCIAAVIVAATLVACSFYNLYNRVSEEKQRTDVDTCTAVKSVLSDVSVAELLTGKFRD